MDYSAIGSNSFPAFGALPANSSSNMIELAAMNMGNAINAGKNGLPKYSFHKSISLNKSNRIQNSLSFGGGCTVIAIIEGKGTDRGQIGMATMDVRNSELILCQFVDTSSYSLLKIHLTLHDPVEIILPEDKEKNAFINDVLKDICPKATVTPILRRYFNDALGIELINKHRVEECSQIDPSVNKKYYCMSAAAALIKYVEYIQNISFTYNSLKITYISIENSCMIDVNSWKSLDLIHLDVKPIKGKPNSLFEILNCCVTSSGMNMLKSYLLQPSAELTVINQRLDIVQELVSNQSMCDRLRNILSTLGDLRQLISLCTYICVGAGMEREESKRAIRFKITQVNALRNLLDSIKKLSNIVCASKNPFFAKSKEKLNDFRLNEIYKLILEKITTEVFNRKRKGSVLSAKDMVLFTVAEKQHVQLDLARRTYQELVQHITDLGNKQQKELPGAVLNYTQSRGYHFSLHANDPYIVRLPPYCIQIVFNKSSITFTTRELVKYNDRLMETENEILQKSNLIMDQLLASIREFLPALYHCAEIISSLDYYCALACYSSRVTTVRPKFADKLHIQSGRHPILDYRKDVVPNNTFASHNISRFIVIAGPNMAGKTTYMRQVCLLQILAQMGCMVPADSATFILMTRIFSRVGHNDDLTRNLSGFSVEMSEMAVILQNCDQNSLVIIDELARSTSTEEGIAICYAICESLLLSKAIVFIATHFLDMAQLASNYPTIVHNYHFDPMTIIDKTGIERSAPHHQLVEGAYRGPLYGLDLAELTTFPEKIISDARKMAGRIRKTKEKSRPKEDTSDNAYTTRMLNTSNPDLNQFTPLFGSCGRLENLNSTI